MDLILLIYTLLTTPSHEPFLDGLVEQRLTVKT